MPRLSTWLILLALMAVAASLHAGTVYTWTDANGVRHFGNTDVPDGAEAILTTPDDTAPPVPDTAETTPGQAPPENSAAPPAGQVAESPPEAQEEAPADEDARVAEERALLEAEIKRVEGRAISRTFSQGMKQGRLRPLYARLSLLNSDPEKYFQMKDRGSFEQLQEQDQESPPPGSGNITSSSSSP